MVSRLARSENGRGNPRISFVFRTPDRDHPCVDLADRLAADARPDDGRSWWAQRENPGRCGTNEDALSDPEFAAAIQFAWNLSLDPLCAALYGKLDSDRRAKGPDGADDGGHACRELSRDDLDFMCADIGERGAGIVAVAFDGKSATKYIRLAVLRRRLEAGDAAEEFADEGRCRFVVDFGRRADLFDLTGAHDDDAVGEFQRLLLVMRHENGGEAGFSVQFAQPASEFLANLCIECAERLVEQKHARLDGKGAGERDALALAARNLARETGFQPLKLHEIQQAVYATCYFAGVWPFFARAHAQSEGDIAEDCHVPEQRILLEDEADTALTQRERRRVLAVEADRAFLGCGQPRNGAQKRRLAGAGGTEQREQFARPHRERDILQRGESAVGLAQPFNVDPDRRGALPLPRLRGTSAVRSRQARHRSAIRGRT